MSATLDLIRSSVRSIRPTSQRPAYRLRQSFHSMALEARLAARQFQQCERMRPTIFVIGVQKAGTTTLFDHLARHEQILPPIVKEVHYFDVAWNRGERWYNAHFPTTAEAMAGEDALGHKLLTFDTTPYYMFHPDVSRRVLDFSPGAKVIALLRDPVARTWSHYWHERARGREHLPPMEAFLAEPERVPDPHNHVGSSRRERIAHQHYSYCARSEYDIQLRRWMELLPKQRILCLKSEDLFTDPGASLARVSRFLEISAFAESPSLTLNAGRYVHPPQDVREWLQSRLAPSQQATRDLAGSEFSWTDDEQA